MVMFMEQEITKALVVYTPPRKKITLKNLYLKFTEKSDLVFSRYKKRFLVYLAVSYVSLFFTYGVLFVDYSLPYVLNKLIGNVLIKGIAAIYLLLIYSSSFTIYGKVISFANVIIVSAVVGVRLYVCLRFGNTGTYFGLLYFVLCAAVLLASILISMQVLGYSKLALKGKSALFRCKRVIAFTASYLALSVILLFLLFLM